MIDPLRRHPIGVSACLFLALLAPPIKHVLEASMTAQMLLQIPLLVGVGCVLSRALPAGARALADEWNYRGITGLVLASVTSAFWMLPRMLDAAVNEPLVDVAKYLSVPLLIGVPFALSWPRMTFIVRGVFLVELIATFFRLGWLYLIWPERLCNIYLLDDQQRLGQYMLLIGAALFFGLAAKLIWGRFDSLVEPRPLMYHYHHAADPLYRLCVACDAFRRPEARRHVHDERDRDLLRHLARTPAQGGP